MSDLMEMTEYERHKYDLEAKEVDARIKREDKALELKHGNRKRMLQMLERSGPYIFFTFFVATLLAVGIWTYQYYNEGAVKTHNQQVECINAVPMRTPDLTDGQKKRLLFDCFEIEVDP